MTYADLHMHSTASDGTFDASQILDIASDTPGLRAIAITDHDALESSRAALELCSGYDIDVIPGLEVTTRHEGRAIHMLGYFVDPSHGPLSQYLEENRMKRKERTCAMADLLHDAGYPISSDDIRGAQDCANRPLLARILVERGIVESVDEAFSNLIGVRSPYFIEVEYPETLEAIRLIQEAGGFAYIAHPARYRVIDLIAPLAREGMAGLEAYHTQHSPEHSRELVKLARELNLGISGGSDWHGDDVHAATIGGAGLSEKDFASFLEACDRA